MKEEINGHFLLLHFLKKELSKKIAKFESVPWDQTKGEIFTFNKVYSLFELVYVFLYCAC